MFRSYFSIISYKNPFSISNEGLLRRLTGVVVFLSYEVIKLIALKSGAALVSLSIPSAQGGTKLENAIALDRARVILHIFNGNESAKHVENGKSHANY